MNETPLYATLLYDVRKQLDISIAEYFYLDMIYHLSYDRWCSKSIQKCADDMGLKKRGLLYMRDRLLERGLLKKNRKGELKVTRKYIEVAVQKVHRPENPVVQKVHRPVQKLHRSGAKIAPPYNKMRITENNIENKGSKNLASSQLKPNEPPSLCDYTIACNCGDCTYKRAMRATASPYAVGPGQSRIHDHFASANGSRGLKMRQAGKSAAAQTSQLAIVPAVSSGVVVT